MSLPGGPLNHQPMRANRTRIEHHLRQIALGLQQYHDTYKGLPPAVVRDKDGKPLYSWRVLILPFIEEGSLYKDFRRNEPWDSPHNIQLLPQMPSLFWVPEPKVPAGHTYIQAFVGENAGLDPSRKRRIPDDFPDGPSRTILVVEAAEPVLWTAPFDLVYDPAGPLPELGAVSRDRFVMAMGDASVRLVRKQYSEATLRALITRDGGETLGSDWRE
jgi:hypothetical protein